MMTTVLLRAFWSFLLLTACATAARSDSVAHSSAAPKVEDPRLSRSLTLDLMQVPLSDLCQVMEKRSGAAHRPADAATGDLRADVVGTMTVAQLQQALAVVLGVTWQWEGEGDTAAYVVSQPPEKRREEAREQAETDRAYGEGLQRLLDAANLPDAARAQLPHWLQSRLAKPRQRATLQLLGDLTPEERALALAGGGVERPVASLSPAGQARVKEIVADLERKFNEDADRSLADPPKPGTFRPVRRSHPLNLDDGQPWRVRITRPTSQPGGGSTSYTVSVSSPNELGMSTGISVEPELYNYNLRLSDAVRLTAPAAPNPEPAGTGAGGARNNPLPPLPEQFQPHGQRWEEIVRDLASRLHCPVVSDAYRPTGLTLGGIEPAQKDDTLESYLDRTCRFELNRRWGRVGPVLLFQRRDWATQRRGQIPESLARRWKQPIIDSGRLSFNHLVEMAALNPYQLPNLGEMMGREADRVMEHRELLLLWQTLPAAHRAALRGAGLALRDLPLGVQPRARALVSEMLGSSAPLALSNAELQVVQTEDAFTFSVHSPDRPAMARRIELVCPPWWQQQLRAEAETRAAALRAAGEAPARAMGQSGGSAGGIDCRLLPWVLSPRVRPTYRLSTIHPFVPRLISGFLLAQGHLNVGRASEPRPRGSGRGASVSAPSRSRLGGGADIQIALPAGSWRQRR
jgi:hypothetical protein